MLFDDEVFAVRVLLATQCARRNSEISDMNKIGTPANKNGKAPILAMWVMTIE